MLGTPHRPEPRWRPWFCATLTRQSGSGKGPPPPAMGNFSDARRQPRREEPPSLPRKGDHRGRPPPDSHPSLCHNPYVFSESSAYLHSYLQSQVRPLCSASCPLDTAENPIAP